MKIAAFATVKLDSQRVPHKNLQPIGSKPLCYHILNTALKIDKIDNVYVYCSDSEIIKHIPKDVTFIQRDSWLDGNEIRAKDTYTAFLKDIEADIYIAMCTTSPFTKKETLQHALDKVLNEGYDSAFSAVILQDYMWINGKPFNYDVKNIVRTQDLEPIFIETGAFFIFRKEVYKELGQRIGNHPYICKISQFEAVDIDTAEDFEFAEVVASYLFNQ